MPQYENKFNATAVTEGMTAPQMTTFMPSHVVKAKTSRRTPVSAGGAYHGGVGLERAQTKNAI